MKTLKVKGLIFKIFEIPLKFKCNGSLTFELPLNIKILPLLRSTRGLPEIQRLVCSLYLLQYTEPSKEELFPVEAYIWGDL